MTDAAFGQTWAQLLDAEQALRALAEGQVRAYVGVLEQLAHTLAPAEADARKRSDPAYFKRLTAPEWLAFLGAATSAAQPPAPGAGWGAGAGCGSGSARRSRGMGRLRRDLAVVQAENNRLRDLVQQLRQEKAALAASLKERPGGRKPAPAGVPGRRPGSARNCRKEAAASAGGQAAGRAAAGAAAREVRQPVQQLARRRAGTGDPGSDRLVAAAGDYAAHRPAVGRQREGQGAPGAVRGLENRKLVQQHVEVVDGTVAADSTTGQVRIGIVRLGELAGRVLTELGLQPVPSEWERLEARDGPEQVKHAAWVCALADHARQRGYKTEVCPQAERPRRPDLLLVKDDEQAYVAVRGAELATPWAELTDENGAVALCTPTRQVRQYLVAAAKAAGIAHGRATDLELLLSGDDRGALWAETW